MSDQHPPTDPALWEGVWSWLAMIGAAGAGAVAGLKGKARKSRSGGEEEIVDAINRLCEVQEQTRDELRRANETFGNALIAANTKLDMLLRETR